MFTSDDEIIRIGEGLRHCNLPKVEWTHAAHIAAAVWLLDQHGGEAFDLMPDLIRTYNEATGVQNTDSSGYHHTITMASLKSLQANMGTGPLHRSVNRLLSMGYNKPDWLLEHYCRDRLFSVEARCGWVEPDKRTLEEDW